MKISHNWMHKASILVASSLMLRRWSGWVRQLRDLDFYDVRLRFLWTLKSQLTIYQFKGASEKIIQAQIRHFFKLFHEIFKLIITVLGMPNNFAQIFYNLFNNESSFFFVTDKQNDMIDKQIPFWDRKKRQKNI